MDQLCEIDLMHSSSQAPLYHYMFTSPLYVFLQYLPVFPHYLNNLYYSYNVYSKDSFFFFLNNKLHIVPICSLF